MSFFFFFSSRRRHTRSLRDWSSDVCSSDLDEASLHPGDDVRRSQEIDSTVGTPLTRSVNSDFLPWRQSAELHTRTLPALITSARYFVPTLKVHVLAPVDTTSTSNSGRPRAG